MMSLDLAIRLAIAAVAGAVVGVERQWSGHADGPQARFAGVRTFTMLGLVGGMTGVLHEAGAPLAAGALLVGAAALVVAAYASAARHDVDGTTEVAALVVLAAGTLAGIGHLVLASGIATLTGLLLVEKSELHALVARVKGDDLRNGIRFAVMAVVILPMLPAGPYGPPPGLRPRELWALVLFFSGLSFAGHIARKAVGARRGLTVAGALGGLISSTNVTLTFARASRDAPDVEARALGVGALAANIVLFPRVLAASAVLSPAMAVAALPWLLPPALLITFAAAVAARGGGTAAHAPHDSLNPLRVPAALQMAALFQIVLYAVHMARAWFGEAGLFGSAAALGLTDVDALTMTMARSVTPAAGAEVAARAVAIGVLSNTLLKTAVAVVVGSGAYRRVAGTGLAVTAAGLAALLWLR
ncbi:MAG: DUF4010 domain-containing protein [Vicinamibacterales bacterium]